MIFLLERDFRAFNGNKHALHTQHVNRMDERCCANLEQVCFGNSYGSTNSTEK